MDRGSVLKRGDGVVVDRGLPQEEELGGPIFDIKEISEDEIVMRFSRGVEKKWKHTDDESKRGFGARKPLAPRGAHVWRTSDAAVDKKMKKLIEANAPRQAVQIKVEGSVGTHLSISIQDLNTGSKGVGTTEGELIEAEQKGLGEAAIKKAIGKLGNTDWVLTGDIDLHDLDDSTWCPISWVKKARKDAVEDLIKLQETGVQSPNLDEMVADEGGVLISDIHVNAVKAVINQNNGEEEYENATKISVLARNYDQVDALCQLSSASELREIVIDFLEVEGMARALQRVRESGLKVVLASPRIIKPGEEGIWRTLLRLEPDGLLIRSAGLVHRMMQLGGSGAIVNIGDGQEVKIPELIGDFSLNTVNSITATELLDAGGLSRITASYELNANSITELAEAMGPAASKLEIIAHAHLPIFHTEHCVFARFLSKGDSYLDCGHVCTRNNVHLRDQNGNDNLVLADMGCRNTVFASEAQSGIHSIQEWANAGVGNVRIELVDEGKDDVQNIVNAYLEVLAGNQKARNVWGVLEKVKDSNGRSAGVSYGSFRNTSERRAGEISF